MENKKIVIPLGLTSKVCRSLKEEFPEVNYVHKLDFYVNHVIQGVIKEINNIPVAEVDAHIADLLFNSPTHVEIKIAENRIREAYIRGKGGR